MKVENLVTKGMRLLQSLWRAHYGNYEGAILIGGGLFLYLGFGSGDRRRCWPTRQPFPLVSGFA